MKAWRYRFTLEGKASMFALGEYPAVSLAEARDRCEAARQLVKQGINPAQQRQIDRIKQASDAEITFEKVAREWLQTKDWEDVTKNRRLDMLERVVFGEIGQMPIRAVTPAHVLGILQHTVKRGAPTVAAEARRTMSAVFEYAVATLRADSDPVWPVRKALYVELNEYVLTDEVAKRLEHFLEAYNDYHGANGVWVSGFFALTGTCSTMSWMPLKVPAPFFSSSGSRSSW